MKKGLVAAAALAGMTVSGCAGGIGINDARAPIGILLPPGTGNISTAHTSHRCEAPVSLKREYQSVRPLVCPGTPRSRQQDNAITSCLDRNGDVYTGRGNSVYCAFGPLKYRR